MTITNKIYQITLLSFLFGLFSPVVVRAGEMTGGDYIIKMGTITIGGADKTGPAVRPTDTVGQTTEPFSLTVSTNVVDFGTVKPATFAGGSLDLTVNGAGVHGYSVSAIEDHPLTAKPDIIIPDTACDPSAKCTPTRASPWTSSVAYGFGYNLDGPDTDQTEFADATHFRPFANNAANQNPVVIMSRQGRGEKAAAKLTFRVNVPPSQTSGAYQNTIQFIALPSF